MFRIGLAAYLREAFVQKAALFAVFVIVCLSPWLRTPCTIKRNLLELLLSAGPLCIYA